MSATKAKTATQAKKGAPKAHASDLIKKLPVVSKNAAGRLFYSENALDFFGLPNLIEMQTNSYEWFLSDGLKDMLSEVSPIQDFSGKKIELHFVDHETGEPKYSPTECKYKNLSYEAPLKVHVQLVNKETGEIKEQDVFLGNIPLMTPRGSFIINGIERVVVSQIVRSPGVFFTGGKNTNELSTAKIIPKRGAWLEIETDKKGIISAKIDRKRKIPVTALLRIFGYETDKEIMELFSDVITDINHDYILKTLEKDSAKTPDEAYQAIYKRLRPGDLATPENAKSLIDSMFFDYKKYDMGRVARYKINKRFGLDLPNVRENHTFQTEDFVLILKHLIKLCKGEASGDDIDHLSNRRIRSVGELVLNKFRVGLMRTDRIAKDRMTVMDLETVTPTQLINSRPITAALREFYASSQLSQFMDQTNPLSELAHKRRISAMGPGGLSRERASFDVRDVHQSHYGRICPIATPEGPNIGLVVHLASYARINEYGFLETPFQKVRHTVKNTEKDLIGRNLGKDITDEKGKIIFEKGIEIDKAIAAKIAKLKDKEIPVRAYVTDEVDYFDADEEQGLVIAQCNTEVDENNQFVHKRVAARKNGEASEYYEADVTHTDVSPQQIISITTSLIPFLENDDNTRASMGSNMQRQAVPLVKPQAPLIGTGMEEIAAKSSGHVLLAEDDGVISYADADRIEAIYKNGQKKVYNLSTFLRSNQGTTLTQKVRVETKQEVKKGDVLADGSSTENGELALGANLLVAYMIWEGYNFEDAVVISDRLVKEGVYDTVHIENYTIDIRDTKLGPEQVTRDIPNINEGKLKDLDENGIIRLGATVEERDILVGKITPKGETELTAEERLLRAIFGDKARDVKDTSLRMPGGSGGKVVDIHIFDRTKGDELPNGVNQQIRVSVAKTRKISIGDKVAGRHGNKGVISLIVPQEDMPHLADGTPIDVCLNPLGVNSRMNIGQILETHLGWAARELETKFATPALNGITQEQISETLDIVGLPTHGKTQLFDGKTGEAFDTETTVGITYILKLSHLVEDKIHARSVGPYSLVTQQPLGGKAQRGGQRFGEMEVWALEAYGAAHTLQEMLTIKSDDVYGRSKAFEAIIKGESINKPRTPESFNVLVKELQSLGLNVDLIDSNADDEYLDESSEAQANNPIDPEVAKELAEETAHNETFEELDEAEEFIDDIDLDMSPNIDSHPLADEEEPSAEELAELENEDDNDDLS